MIYTREEHFIFLEEELRAETDVFVQKISSQAYVMLQERDELYIAQFLGFRGDKEADAPTLDTINDNKSSNSEISIKKDDITIKGDMILKFSTKRSIPRRGEFLYCFTVPQELRNFRKWGNLTYEALIKSKNNSSEVVCVWQAPIKGEKDYCLAGFRGIDLNFANAVKEAKGIALFLGPNVPPFEYLRNLQDIVKSNPNNPSLNKILDYDFIFTGRCPVLINNKDNISDFIIAQLDFNDTLMLQGPPGTGKTYQIAEICKKLCGKNKSVLVTALTNRALVEVAQKPALAEMLRKGSIFKTRLTTDEVQQFPDLGQLREVNPMPGKLILSTFYIISGEKQLVQGHQQFDYVIVDEASQALLGMLAAAKLLGKKNLWIGDSKQLSPIVSMGGDKIDRKNYEILVNGFKALSEITWIPFYQLSETYRLPQRAAKYTGCFYNDSLLSKREKIPQFNLLGSKESVFFHKDGGPTLIKTDLEIGDRKPVNALEIVGKLVSYLLRVKPAIDISVLTFFVETNKALQKYLYQEFGYNKNLLIETISRVQGLTTGVVILVIPNSGYTRTLEQRIFNVATSRATFNTVIIADKGIVAKSEKVDEKVNLFLNILDKEFSFYMPSDSIDQMAIMQNTKIDEKSSIDIVEVKDNKRDDNLPIENSPEGENENGKVVGYVDLSRYEKTKKELVGGKNNIYIIDTNVFLGFPEIISKIDKKYTVVLSATVIEELEKLKLSVNEDDRIKIQKALRNINSAMDVRNIIMETADLKSLPIDFKNRYGDNYILSVALKYKAEVNNNPILLTSDIGLQVKAKGLKMSTISLKEYMSERNLLYELNKCQRLK